MALAEMGTTATAAVPVLASVLEGPVAGDPATAQFHIEAAAAILQIAPNHAVSVLAIDVLTRYSRIGGTRVIRPCPSGGALRALRVLVRGDLLSGLSK